MSVFREIVTVTRMNLRNIPKRLGSSLVVVTGIAGVIGVMVSVLAMAVGFDNTIRNTGRNDHAIVLRGGSNSELTSTIGRTAALTIEDAPGVKRDSRNRVLASPETVMLVSMKEKATASQANVTLRGVGVAGLEVHPEIRIAAGRMFQSGKRELIVGTAAQLQFAGLNIGDRVRFRSSEWTVVGTFSSAGNAHESEILADVDSVLGVYRRNVFQSVSVVLESAASFDAFKAALTTNPSLEVQVQKETDYYAGVSARLSELLTSVAYVVGSIMALGAIFGALNTMYAAVSGRRIEIATLRAIGYSSVGVVVSILIEALLLAAAGGVIGATLSWLIFNGNVVNTLGGSFTQVVFRLAVTPKIMVAGLTWALLIGILGGVFPAKRAAALPVVKALRAL